ncbi:YrhA family protein [Enterobacter cloacae]|nr:YrhA family protein [Enterobacter cloacae]WNT38043.1 YrhA family protein [Enterobacter cloacae]
MKSNVTDMLIELRKMMADLEYPVEQPINALFLDSLTKKRAQTSSPILDQIGNEACHLLVNQPDYTTFIETMDGFEYNGLTMFSLSIPEPIIKNFFIMNEFYRNNDYLDPELQQRLVIGEDGISLFTYDAKVNLFEIRDNASTGSIYGSFDNFSDFLKEIITTIK